MKKQITLIFAFLLLTFPVKAQETVAYTVFPAVQDIKVTPGQKTRAQIQFRNNSDTLSIGNIKVADFIVIDKSGSTQILEDQLLKPKYSASSWIKLSDETNVAIPKNEIVTITLYITPPPVLTSCGYYALVYYQPNPSAVKRLGAANQEAASSVTTKIGGLLNFVVEGKQCQENMFISQIKSPGFLEYGPVSLTVDLANTGDIHLTPSGYATMTNMFGSFVDQQNFKEQRIFPSKAKQYELSLGQKWMFGRYKVTLTAVYGASHKRLTDTVYVWVLPWRVGLIILLAAIIIFTLIRNFYKKIINKEISLEKEINQEKEEIAKLREALKKRKD